MVDLLGITDNPGSLRSISVSPKALTTNFVPSGHDYAIVCDAGTNTVTVTAGSLPGYTVAIGAASAPNTTGDTGCRQSASTRRDRRAARHHRRRPLLHPMPAARLPCDSRNRVRHRDTWLVHGHSHDICTGFALRGHRRRARRAAVVPQRRRPRSSISNGCRRVRSPGASAWVPVLGPAFGVDPTHGYEIHEFNGTLTARCKTVGPPTDQHDMIALPNGNYALFAYEADPTRRLDVAGMGFGADETVVRGRIQEVDAGRRARVGLEGRRITSTSRRARSPCVSTSTAPRSSISNTSTRSMIAPNGDYIVSARHMDAVFRVDHGRRQHRVEARWNHGQP